MMQDAADVVRRNLEDPEVSLLPVVDALLAAPSDDMAARAVLRFLYHKRRFILIDAELREKLILHLFGPRSIEDSQTYHDQTTAFIADHFGYDMPPREVTPEPKAKPKPKAKAKAKKSKAE